MGNVHPPSGEAGAGFTTPWGLVGVNFLQWSPVKHPARGATRHAQTSSKPGSLRWGQAAARGKRHRPLTVPTALCLRAGPEEAQGRGSVTCPVNNLGTPLGIVCRTRRSMDSGSLPEALGRCCCRVPTPRSPS